MSSVGAAEARLAALEAENVALRERLVEAEQDTDRTLLRATRLAQIVSALGQLDPSGRVARVAGEVAELFSADIGLLLLGEDHAVRVEGRWGVTEADLDDGPFALPDGLDPETDVLAGPRALLPMLPALDGFEPRHVAWVRLRVQERCLGLLCLVRRADQSFSSSDRHELRAIGARVALAIEHADLQRRTGDQLEQMQVLHRMSAALAGTVDPGEAARHALQTLRSLAPDASVAAYRSAGSGWARLAMLGPRELPTRLGGATPTCDDPEVEVFALRDGTQLVGAIAMHGVPQAGLARTALPHIQHVAGLALGKTVLHEWTARQARHDALTGLPNRVLMRERIDADLAAGRPLGIIFLDLDRFKVINDSLGHDVGDQLLVEVAGRLRAAVRPMDSVARIGGDEFVVLCDGLDVVAGAERIAERIGRAIAEPFDLGGTHLRVSTSQGIALSTPGQTAETLLRDADTAMYRAKARGKARYEVFDDHLRADVIAHLGAEQALHDAVADHRLRVRYQPIVDLRTDRLTAVEAVLCYEDRDGALVTADAFTSIAEESELIVGLGRWLLPRACADMAGWIAELGELAPDRVLLNVSGRELARDDHLDQVRAALADAGLPPNRLGVELTESVLLHGGDRVHRALLDLHGCGIGIGMDDFGNGYSSLTFLRRFPIDLVKIGSEFVEGLLTDPDDAAIVEAIVGLAGALRLRSAAEGVCEPEQLRTLRELGCDDAQGPLLGGLQRADALADVVRSGAASPTLAAGAC